MVSSESNEVCSKEDRKTIAPEHVLKELQSLRDSESYTRWFSVLGNYIYEQHKLETMDPVRGGKCANVREMTEEEAAAEQQRMFAEEARARMNGVAPTVSVTKVEAVLRMLWRFASETFWVREAVLLGQQSFAVVEAFFGPGM
ncbi:putative transcription factor Hap3/NF-YB family [Helianthus annuus]|nr:putative transcription factor Hap3/NF-YB family [Helianthus annuus]